MSAQVLVLAGSGLNTDLEFQLGFEMAGASADRRHVNELLNGKVWLEAYDILVIPGGFSFGDHLSAGRVLASKFRVYLKDKLEAFIAQGKLILGVCNGAQFLLKLGLLPFGGKQVCTLTYNDSGKFEDRWVRLKVEETGSAFTQGIREELYLPIRCGEGKFVTTPEVLEYLETNHLVALRYIDEDVTGSMNKIAGICDTTGRILAAMAHPETHLTRYHHPCWTREQLPEEGQGLQLLKNAVRYVEEC